MMSPLSRVSQIIIKWCTIALVVVVPVIHGCQDTREEPFKIGVEMIDITPPAGHSHYSGISTGVLDPLHTKALVFSQGETIGALVVCDLLSIPRYLNRVVRENASEKTGIPFQHISIAATHTHTGPSIRDAVKEYGDREADGELTAEDQEGYIGALIRGITEAIVRASENLQEDEMIAGVGNAPGISFNRRFLMTDGRVLFNPGRQNPRIVRAVASVDPDVHFAMFRPVAGDAFIASLTVFASHYACGGTEYSADYPNYLQKRLREFFGDQLTSVFAAWTCGDINTVDVTRSSPAAREGEEWVETVGYTLAEAINDTFPYGRQLRPRLGVASRTIYLPLQGYTEEELAWSREGTGPLHNEREGMIRRFRGKILELEQMRQKLAVPPSVSGDPFRLPVEIHSFMIDPETAIVTIPGEVFAEPGLNLKARSPFANTMVIELANHDIRYVPTKRAFKEGDYEAIHSRLAPGSGEEMVNVALEMLAELKNSVN